MWDIGEPEYLECGTLQVWNLPEPKPLCVPLENPNLDVELRRCAFMRNLGEPAAAPNHP